MVLEGKEIVVGLSFDFKCKGYLIWFYFKKMKLLFIIFVVVSFINYFKKLNVI